MDLSEICGYHTIMIIADNSSKMVVLVPLLSMDMGIVANAFFCHVISHHGLQLTIMTDWD